MPVPNYAQILAQTLAIKMRARFLYSVRRFGNYSPKSTARYTQVHNTVFIWTWLYLAVDYNLRGEKKYMSQIGQLPWAIAGLKY